MSPKNQRNAKKVLAFFYSLTKKYKLSLLGIAVSVPLAQLSNNIIGPLILARVLDRISTKDYIAGQPWQSFQSDILLYAAVAFSGGLVLWRIVDAFVWRLEGKMLRDIAQYVYKNLVEQSADFHANHFGGSLVSQNSKLLSAYIRIADTNIYGLLPLFVSVAAAAIILTGRAPFFAIGLVIFSVIYLVATYFISAPTRVAGAKHAAAESKQTGYLADSITNAMAIKSFASDGREFDKFAKVTERTRSALLNLMRKNQIQMVYFTSLMSLINIGSLIGAIFAVVQFDAEVSTAFLIFSYTSNIMGQLFQFSTQALRNYNRAIGDASEMIEIINTKPEVQDPVEPESPRISRGAVEFKNVTFGHKGEAKPIFDNLNLRIKPGEKIGLVGHSGAGKTTITRLLLRFSDIQSGIISVDGQDISKITQNDLRKEIAYVPQEPLLFHRSLAENIGYSNPQATPAEIRAIAKKANSAEFIESLPEKYDTLVGERGIKLSGGQRQRVAIARAMLKNAPILVLDEATSALDSESEELIQDALWKLMEGRTAIVIAHRLSTIQKMDRILVMDKGKIVEEGTHKELIRKKNGVYAKLWTKQSGGFIDGEE